MIDYKNLAAGDYWNETPETPVTKKIIATPKQASHASQNLENHEIRCIQCGKNKQWGKNCLNCAEIAKIPCSNCHKPFGMHSLEYGSRTRRRQWYAESNHPIICYPENDPVKQKKIPQTDSSKPRFIWEDIIQ